MHCRLTRDSTLSGAVLCFIMSFWCFDAVCKRIFGYQLSPFRAKGGFNHKYVCDRRLSLLPHHFRFLLLYNIIIYKFFPYSVCQLDLASFSLKKETIFNIPRELSFCSGEVKARVNKSGHEQRFNCIFALFTLCDLLFARLKLAPSLKCMVEN